MNPHLQTLLLHVGDVNGNLSQPSRNKLCANLTKPFHRDENTISCKGGPLPGKFVELRTRWPQGRPLLEKYALFIAEISVVFEEGRNMQQAKDFTCIV